MVLKQVEGKVRWIEGEDLRKKAGVVMQRRQDRWGEFVEGLESECKEVGLNVLLDWEAEKIL